MWEHLIFHGTLRLPSGTSEAGVRAAVGRTMRDLGIDNVADSFVGDEFTRGLSGGEKRRVSIATELLTSPGIMFLDEPTTGLDSTNAAKVVDILSGLGRLGVTVLLSIHQPRPDIFRLLDRVLVLSGRGRVVYSGPSDAAEAHFARLDYVTAPSQGLHIADYMLDAVLRSPEEVVARMVEDYARSGVAADVADAIDAQHARRPGGRQHAAAPTDRVTAKFRSSYVRQVTVLCGRLVRVVRRHPFLLALNFAATALASLSIGKAVQARPRLGTPA